MANAMLPRERSDYSAIVDRPPLKLPGGARLVLWTIVNLEVWDIRKPMARQVIGPPAGQLQLPDVPNWSWHEYGMRVGVWRFFDLFKRLNIRPTLALNARVCEDYPRVAEQARSTQWEFMGHAYEQGPIHAEPDQKAMVARTLDGHRTFLRQAAGRLARTRAHRKLSTRRTSSPPPESNISATGFTTMSRRRIRTAAGPLVTLPYTVELNDIPMMIIQHHESDYLLRRAIDQFDRLYAEGRERAKIMALAIHPYISGQPHRIKYLEAIYEHARRHDGVVYWTGEEILDWYLRSGPAGH